MNTAEIVIWSAAAGALGLVVSLTAVDAFYRRSRGSLQTFIYLFGCWLFVVLLSGLATTLTYGKTEALHVAQVLIGPLCSCIGSYSVSRWLSARQRDQISEWSFQAVTWLCFVGAPLCFYVPYELQLPMAASLSVSNMVVATWLSVRAGQQGDRLAWGLAAGCVPILPMQVGLYWLALVVERPSVGLQVALALLGLVGLSWSTAVLWLRNQLKQQLQRQGHSEKDPITRLYSSSAIVQEIVRAQKRQRGHGALLVVLVFEPERLTAQVGMFGLTEIYAQLARRMQQQIGVVNRAGRYFDRCFVVLLESLHSPRWMRTFGLRVAANLRKPIEVTSLTGERIKVSVDLGVGLVAFSGTEKGVDLLLDRAQKIAQAARGMRSRAAVFDLVTGQAVPVESADLGTRWKDMPVG